MTSLCHLGNRDTVGSKIPWRGTDEAAKSQHDDFVLDALTRSGTSSQWRLSCSLQLLLNPFVNLVLCAGAAQANFAVGIV